MALRTRNRGRTGLKDTALARFGFFAHLRTHVLLAKGVGAPSFTRATVATVKDFEGNIRNCLSGEVRFEGQRRVRNLLGDSTTLYPNPSIWGSAAGGTGSAATCTGGFTDPDGGTTAWRIQANRGAGDTSSDLSYWFCNAASSGPTVGSVWIKSNTGAAQRVALRYSGVLAAQVVTATTEWQRLSVSYDLGSTPVANSFAIGTRGVAVDLPDRVIDVLVWHPQLENVTNQSNQNPSEYVSVGAAKLNMLLQTEAINTTPWADVQTPIVAANGFLGGVPAWDITDNDGAQFEGRVQSVIVPNDSTTYYFSIRVKKTTGGTSPTFGLNVFFGGGAPTISRFYRLNTDTGAAPYGNAWTQVIDRGDYWECSATQANNALGNTTLQSVIYPAIAGFGGVADSAAATGTATVAAPQTQTISASQAYFPVGNVYPYHGACVDGVKYFDYENGNTVSSNVVTEAVGRSLEGYSVALLDGTTGYFSTPDSTALRITGKISLRAQVRAEDFTPSATQALIAKSGNRYMLRNNTTGGLIFTWYDGSVQTSHSSTLPFPASDKTMLWARTDFEPDNGAGGRTTRFYWSADYDPDAASGTWTLFDTITDAGVTQIGGHDTGALTVGYSASGPILTGAIRRAQVFNNDTGTKVADFNPREGWTENLLVQSQDLNTTWSSTAATVSTNAITAPDGTLTADKIVEAAGVSEHGRTQGSLTYEAGVYEASVYAKAGERTWLTLEAWDGTTAHRAYFNLTTGVVGSTVSANSISIESVGNGWYRCAYKFTAVATAAGDVRVGLAIGDLGHSYNGDGTSGLYAWGAQLHRLSVAGQRTTSQYLPTTTAALRGWISSTGEQWGMNGAATVLQRQADGYLSEPSTTNLVLQSSNFGTTWAATLTPTRVATAAYCGDIALDLIGDDDAGGGGPEYYSQSITFTGDAQKSVSALVKQGTSTSSVIQLYDVTLTTNRLVAVVTWSAGVPVVTCVTGSQERAPEAMGNGVFRIFMLTTSVTAASVNSLRICPATDNAFAQANTGTLYCGGVQAENVTFASSLQPTTTGAAARNADQLTWPGAGNVSQTTGTIYAEGQCPGLSGVNGTLVSLEDGTSNERIQLLRGSGFGLRVYVADGGVNQADLTDGTINRDFFKAATRYAVNDFAASYGGRTPVADVAGTLPTTTTIYAGVGTGANYLGGPMKNLRIAQLVESNTDIVTISK